MRAIVYTRTGEPDVLRLVDRPVPEAGPGEVRVRIHVSGVNPTDWKSRRGSAAGQPLGFPEVVPNQDGAGVIDAVGPGVEPGRVGQRVWVWEAAWQRPGGTAQEYVVLPERQAVPLPDSASYDLAASLPIPFLTAHRGLTVTEGGPDRLGPGALDGRTVLVAGGAGAVGNAAIQLARWAGGTVITTVSSPEKATLAAAAGAQHVVNYRTNDVVETIHKIVPDGVDTIVEVAPAANAQLNAQVLARYGSVAVYADDGGELTLPIRPFMVPNARWQFVLIYNVPEPAKDAAIGSVTAALSDGAIGVGEEAGLPLHHFPLERAAEAHAAVESSIVGKVLIDVQSP